jgi:predicted nucleotidyltransferase
MLRTVAEAMGDLRESVVFLGGAVLSYLLSAELSRYVRRAKDVDFIIDFDRKADLFAFEDALWELGFKKVSNGAVCLWLLGRIKVDALPADPEVFTFNNQWCAEGMKYAERIDIGGGLRVNAISAPYYLGTKLNAFDRRGYGDFATSKDIFDLLLIFAGHRNIEEAIQHRTSPAFKAFLREKLDKLREGSVDFLKIAALGFGSDPVLSRHLPEAVSRMRAAQSMLVNKGITDETA